jgi:hypothetical protein
LTKQFASARRIPSVEGMPGVTRLAPAEYLLAIYFNNELIYKQRNLGYGGSYCSVVMMRDSKECFHSGSAQLCRDNRYLTHPDGFEGALSLDKGSEINLNVDSIRLNK